MAEHREEREYLDGKRVEIFLNTPLFRFRYVFNNEERELLENAVRISGVVLREKRAGLLVKAEELSNMKLTESELPFERIFIPYGKIDFVVVS
ncbi:MAG TPA: hypothetical protein VI895_05850 [Bdellovibrionota bacterium]|nr:hypothetical protein [Bdellovibrionota bacterium]